jgi:hypothetical protein
MVAWLGVVVEVHKKYILPDVKAKNPKENY